MSPPHIPHTLVQLNTNNQTAFYLKNSQQKHLWTYYLCHHGNDPEPAYSLRYPDPSSPSSKNRYAVALCDPFVPDVVYGEVLLVPEWTQPSLSADAIPQNGGVAPPPEPILPSQFTVHLYNPDQHIVVRYKPKTWNSPATWEFEMPQYTFRQPSSSTLDRTQQDPSVADVTPKLRFGWKKDSKLSKDLACLLSGKTAMGPETKTKSKEPDITISIFKGLREMTLYEPNLYRVEMEDFKGLEVVLLLGAQTIRDVWFSSVKDAFKIAHDAPKLLPKTAVQQNAVPGQKPAAGQRTSPTTVTSPAAAAAAAIPNGHKPQPAPAPVASGAINTNSRPAPERPRITIPQRESKPLPQIQPTPPPGPGPSEADIEHRRQRKQKEADEKARRKQQAEVDKETKRLQKIYGSEEEQVRKHRTSPAHPRPRPHPQWQQRPPQPQRPFQPPRPHLPPRPGPGPGPYLNAPAPHGRHSSVQFLPVQQPQQMRPQSTGARPPALQQKKSSFFGFRKTSDDKDKLHKKRSSMF